MREDFLSALPLMLRHRACHARSRRLSLDDLLDDCRQAGARNDSEAFRAGTMDLVLMGYRYSALFEAAWRDFAGAKSPRPPELEDLLKLLFAAVMSRDQTPGPVLVTEAVEAAKEAFGRHVAGVVNAFGRRSVAEKAARLAAVARSPESSLPSALRERWAREPEIVARTARQLLQRPEAGIWSFDAQGRFERRPATTLLTPGAPPFQALDPGSWGLIEWILEQWPPGPRGSIPRALDACAAPGGKLLALAARRPDSRWMATDAKFGRLERLRDNVQRWRLEDRIDVRLHPWGDTDSQDSNEVEGNFDLILADLPCSGSGTLHTRPDLLSLEWIKRLPELRLVQARILSALHSRLAPGASLFVSLCSVDPAEVAGVSEILGTKPAFRSWDQTSETCEGLTAWRVIS